MSEEATEAGVSKPGVREETMSDIAAKLRAQRNLENGITEEPIEESLEEEIEIETEYNEEPLQAAPEKRKVKIKIEGEESEVDEDKIIEAGIRTFQKESLADKRLQEATELLKQAKAKEEHNEIIEEDDMLYSTQDVLDMYAMGDTESAAEALNAIIERRSQATVNMDEIREELKKGVQTEFLEREFKNAVSRFQQEYPDIYEDHRLMAVVAAEEQRLRNEGDERTYWEIYNEIGKNVREWHSPTSGGLDAKKEKKKSIDNITGSNAPSNKQQAYRPKTQSEIIEEMRKARSV